MPRKKRSLARGAPVPAGKHTRRVLSRDSLAISATTPSGRPSRKCATVMSYAPIPIRGLKSNQAKSVKDENTDPISEPKPRGRPPKAANTTATTSSKSTSAAAPTGEVKAVKPGRGRPRKASVPIAAPTPTGKPAKASPKRKRTDDERVSEQPPAKKRGRPPKDTNAGPAKSGKEHAVKIQKEAKNSKTTSKPAKNVTKAKAEPKARKPRTPKNAITTTIYAEVAQELLEEHEKNEGTQYWLMKAEPEAREVNGIDVSFPIDKLAAATEPEPWDGVRNPVARNNMRAMRKGDLAFFYHSNCSIPGVVGAMRIVEEHTPDESAFDPNHPYFDAKSKREKPTWDCVKVEFVKKFENTVSLKALKGDPKLANMQIAQKAYSRLSVQAVTPAQWSYVLKMAGEPDDVGVLPVVSGYEADTNGETDGEAVEDSVGIDDVDAVKMTAHGKPDELVDDGDRKDADGTATVIVNGTAETHHSTVKLSDGLDDDDAGADEDEDEELSED